GDASVRRRRERPGRGLGVAGPGAVAGAPPPSPQPVHRHRRDAARARRRRDRDRAGGGDGAMSMLPDREPFESDVALILEGTYPYVAGGVSSWVHQILQSCPTRKFALFHIAPYPGAYEKLRYQIPSNVTTLAEAFCRAADDQKPRKAHLPGLAR